MTVFRMQLIAPFCSTSATVPVRQSKSPEDREIGRRFAPLWKALVPKLRGFFLGEDAKGNYVVPSLDVRAQILSIHDRRNGIGKPVFSFAPCDTIRNSMSLLLEPHISDVVFQKMINGASTPVQIREANV